MTLARRFSLVLASAVVALGCATLATEAGDEGSPRPNAHAGPFRYLRSDEVDNFDSPYVLKKSLANFREATALDLDESGALGDSAIYAVALLASKPGIYRFLASDGRSFSEAPTPSTPVLAATEAWEGTALDTPEVARVGGEIFLYYSADGGIGLARSSDGVSFTKEPAPVLDAGGPAWENGGTPRAPAFVEVSPGDYRLFYEVADRIGEARSSDGISWQRMGDAPVLEPAPIGDPADPAFDSSHVGDPDAWVAVTPEGRRVTRVYYAGSRADGESGIGLAARYADDGLLTRAPAPALTGPRKPHAPSVLAYRGLTLLFVTQDASTSDDYPAVAAGIAPATASIPVK
jgi:hypothetical protein